MLWTHAAFHSNPVFIQKRLVNEVLKDSYFDSPVPTY